MEVAIKYIKNIKFLCYEKKFKNIFQTNFHIFSLNIKVHMSYPGNLIF